MAYLDNSSSLLSNQSVGIKISQPGIDAKTASATQLIFSSSWPSMAVLFHTTYVAPTAFTSLATIPHKLGFPPFTRVWLLDSSGNIGAGTVQNATWGVDNNNFYIRFPDSFAGYTFYIECYNVDLSKDIDYPSLPYVAYKTTYDSSYGIKITKDGKTAQSTNPRDFVLHSRYRSPLVKAVKTQATINSANITGSGATIQYTNKDGVATWNYGFVKVGGLTGGLPSGSYLFAPYFSQAYPQTYTDGITTSILYSTSSSDLGATIVILRDPLIANNIVNTSY